MQALLTLTHLKMRQILYILLLIPFINLSQSSNKIVEIELNDSVHSSLTINNKNIGDTIFKSLENKTINLYKIDTTQCLKLELIKNNEHLQINYLKQIHQIKTLDYLSLLTD